MEEKDYSRSPAEGENQHGDDSVKESDLASYYAAAASAAASGHEFREEDGTENASGSAASSASGSTLPESDAPETADETAGGETPQSSDESMEEGRAADISEDGSPHGPLDFFSEQQDSDTKEDGQEEEKQGGEETAAREPEPAHENVPAYAAFLLLAEKPRTADDIVGETEIPARRVNTAASSISGFCATAYSTPRPRLPYPKIPIRIVILNFPP